jgi:predicted DNA-binding transcriptional regulator YafY
LSQTAILQVSPASAAWFHFDLDAGQGQIEINFMDMHLFAEELMEFSDQIEVIEPKELADLIKSNLKQVSDDHA